MARIERGPGLQARARCVDFHVQGPVFRVFEQPPQGPAVDGKAEVMPRLQAAARSQPQRPVVPDAACDILQLRRAARCQPGVVVVQLEPVQHDAGEVDRRRLSTGLAHGRNGPVALAVGAALEVERESSRLDAAGSQAAAQCRDEIEADLQFMHREQVLLREAGRIGNPHGANSHFDFATQRWRKLDWACHDDGAAKCRRRLLRDGVAPARGIDRQPEQRHRDDDACCARKQHQRHADQEGKEPGQGSTKAGPRRTRCRRCRCGFLGSSARLGHRTILAERRSSLGASSGSGWSARGQHRSARRPLRADRVGLRQAAARKPAVTLLKRRS